MIESERSTPLLSETIRSDESDRLVTKSVEESEPYRFERERIELQRALRSDPELAAIANSMMQLLVKHKYAYCFDWLGLPIIQHPVDIIVLQELIWKVRPAVIIETGIARGGSLVFYASMLDSIRAEGFVIGIDIDIRTHNRRAIESHPLFSRISLFEGSSTDPELFESVRKLVADKEPVLVVLDSMHTNDHVLEELRLYSRLVQPESYIVVMDSEIEHLPKSLYPDRPWSPGNSPMTAIDTFLSDPRCRFEIDQELAPKLILSCSPSGYLRCVR
jgi:cephalosporin hydroxylase